MILDNENQNLKVHEWVKQYTEEGTIDIVTGYFTVGALAYLSQQVNQKITKFRLVLGDIVNLDQVDDRPLDLLNENITIEAALNLSHLAQEAVDFLIQNPDKIHWENFSMNTNPAAIEFLITQHQDKIFYQNLAKNSLLFELDYQAMSLAKLRIYEEELCHKAVLDPRRVKVWLDDFLERGGNLTEFQYEPYSVSNF